MPSRNCQNDTVDTRTIRRINTYIPVSDKRQTMTMSMQARFFKTSAEFRRWLAKSHGKKELWVGFYKRTADKTGLTYTEALDEALCCGWIDAVRKSIDAERYTIRFTPRKPKSYWSAVNIGHAQRLIKLGRMAPPGQRAFDERDKKTAKYSFENKPRKLSAVYEKKFKANKKAWRFFQAQAPWYQRTSNWWVSSAKQEATRLKRLATLIKDSANGRRLGAFTYDAKKYRRDGREPGADLVAPRRRARKIKTR